MAERPLNEGLLTANRISELREQPVEGRFDAAHLREVHRRIFQDLAHHAPGQDRPDAPGHYKVRHLEQSGYKYVVGYLRGKEVAPSLDRVLGELRGGERLKGLDHEAFAERMAKLYGDLDQIHPFREGNSRTLRAFTAQLAREAGYKLDWGTTGADEAARERLYLARDREVLERLYPGLDEARAMSTDSRAEYEAYFVLESLRRVDTLQTIIRETSQPLPEMQWQQAVVQQPALPLKGLDRESFAQEAARRLAAQMEPGTLDPGQPREAAARLAGEGGRQFRGEVITDERLRRDAEDARRGELEGLRQMFREATDREQALLMKGALRLIERSGEDPQRVYLTAARVGQTYEGQVEGKNSRVALVRTADDRVLATAPESLRRAQVQAQGRVRFTAQRGYGLELEE